MDQWKGKVALVTGAGSGIGEALAEALVHHGMVVVGLDIQEDKIKALSERLAADGAPGKLHPLVADLRRPEDILAAFSWIDDTLGGVDVLVNNAGVLSRTKLSEGDTEEWRAVLDVNVLAVAVCTREFLKSMDRRKNQHGHVVILNSVSAWVTHFSQGVMYQASKHAVKGIAMCLRRELAEKGSAIKVTCISPGRTKTNILGSAMEPEVIAMDASDISSAIVNALSASPVTQMCEIIMTPVPTMFSIF
ncbi:farnesol dehydrogenase-like [Macrosteles quadrilineatus]|uniref:farnesol dehydrogenase-like n=1 Tax=Macrosteles quadrilineatus TaxID=74068 RepID=UPI0023E0FAA3|nr:farnesol dehydrogenase-like [Macrosteles quadrilineatus]